MKNLVKSPYAKIILIYIIAQFFPVILLLFVPESALLDANIYGTIIGFVVGALLMFVVNHRSTFDNSLENTPSNSKNSILFWGIAGMFLAFASQYLAVFIETFLLNIPAGSQNTEDIVLIVNQYPIFLILVAIFGPIMEEFVFRKAIFGYLYDITGGIGAAVISSLIFAFIHFDGHYLLYSVMGFVFCYLYWKTKSIAAPIIAHALMNATVTVANLLLY
ncbi:CPBP family intramembrane metalloprotease [Desemzia sp. RIT804]|uniref:CPBP family intramembrane glutamic endopeptidase n=1 Tax=Desemzia sp. RIT 804 TaxID=2810209 RepID=UPI00194DC1DA|nr:type II CAAX endopeptidase family protein [Desemzia sp. RIT 804]MBM6615554.1 CPBP family intramembrane metalloprotease [Desemzia sp. RIT 804]